MKYVNDLPGKTNSLSRIDSRDSASKNNIISSDWKNELKKLGQSKYNGETSHKHNKASEAIDMQDVKVQSTLTKQANVTSRKLKVESSKTKQHFDRCGCKHVGFACFLLFVDEHG